MLVSRIFRAGGLWGEGVPNELRVEELGQGSSAPEPPAQCACSWPQLQLRFSPWADGHFPWLFTHALTHSAFTGHLYVFGTRGPSTAWK